MPYASTYTSNEPSRTEVDAMPGTTVVEFGAPWCGYCQGAQRAIAEALAAHPAARHLKIEDGKGRRLGRSFQVKLWPTLIVLRDGVEIARTVRPESSREIAQALEAGNTQRTPTV